MKKITRIAALLAATAMLFGAVGCSSGGGSDEESAGQGGTGGTGGTGGSGGGEGDGDTVATIVYDASAENPAFALVTGSSDSVFGTVGTTFTKAEMGTIGGNNTYNFAEGYPKVSAISFTPSAATNSKVKDILGSDGKASFTGYLLNSELKDNSTKLDITKDEDNAFVEYSFTLSAAANVKVDVVAFNTQSGNLYGKVSVLDSTGAEKATSGAKTESSKEDNDASVTATALASGTYTVRFAWCPTKTSSGALKAFNGGVQSVSIKATATEK